MVLSLGRADGGERKAKKALSIRVYVSFWPQPSTSVVYVSFFLASALSVFGQATTAVVHGRTVLVCSNRRRPEDNLGVVCRRPHTVDQA